MPRTKRQYGRQTKRTKAEQLFAELPQTPLRKQTVHEPPVEKQDEENDGSDSDSDQVNILTSQLLEVQLEESGVSGNPNKTPLTKNAPDEETPNQAMPGVVDNVDYEGYEEVSPGLFIMKGNPKVGFIDGRSIRDVEQLSEEIEAEGASTLEASGILKELIDDLSLKPISKIDPPPPPEQPMRILDWDDVCHKGDTITKIAEASFAEVYRVSNERGVSIIKVIRLESPIKAQTKAQANSGLVDEEPHRQEDIDGELQISEWLAEIPGFVVYKERYIVKGKGTKALLETHSAFQKKMKKEDPGRAQYYPSPSRYLDDTKFLVVELGDAGTALEDWTLKSGKQLWDIFLLVAIALARAEELAMFEHRDLHEGNLCIKQVQPERHGNPAVTEFFGNSGLEITILDYGLSRAQDVEAHNAAPVALDLETDLSLFTSTHAPQCNVYRQMRSWLLRGDRTCLSPEAHDTPYEEGVNGPVNWKAFEPYSNVLWLAYIYNYLIKHFKGNRRELLGFKNATAELGVCLQPDAPSSLPRFESASQVVHYAFNANWVTEEQLQGISEASIMRGENSIILGHDEARGGGDDYGEEVDG